MKKRVKLLTTIASLCLAVALMAFGVYAATNVNAVINTTISFTSTEISGTWTLTIDGANQTGTTNGDTTTFSPSLSVAGENKTFAYVITFTNSSTTAAKVTLTIGEVTSTDNCVAVEQAADTDTIGSQITVNGGDTATFKFNVNYTASALKDKTQTIAELAKFTVNGVASN